MLRVASVAGLLWLAWDMARRMGWQVQSMSQLRWFAGVVVLPAVATSLILHAFKAHASIQGQMLVLEQSRRRFEIPLVAIVALQPWRVPLPGMGIHLELASGRRWEHGLVVSRPRALWRGLIAAGAPLQGQGRLNATWAGFAQARGVARRPWMDNALVKFGLFPLAPALVAFRLHQLIAFGGTFGEYHTYGAKAWLMGLVIWWASWSMGLMLFAALLRVLIEVMCAALHAVKPSDAIDARAALEWVGRLVRDADRNGTAIRGADRGGVARGK
jgi:apolipoprotein N-acyltransferase